MALIVGGGQSGFGSGGTGGIGQTLNYILDRVFSYSGVVTTDGTNETILISWTSGAEMITGTFQFFYATDTKQTQDVLYQVKLNEQVVAKYITDQDIRMSPSHDPIPIVIPPFSKIECTAKMESSAQAQAVMFTGRLYT